MKKIRILFIIATLCSIQAIAQNKIQVGVFQGNGASETCVWETVSACHTDRSLEIQIVTTKDLASGKLTTLDVLIIPGGGGSREYLNMGGENHKRIKNFVKNGGGLIGICAGAYLTSNTPGYSCLKMSGGKAIDIEHDNRGRGVVKVTLNDEGKKIFSEVANRDTLYLMYYEGPVIVPEESSPYQYASLATMQSDVHVEGNAPSNMTNNRPFFYLTSYEKGKVFSVVGHPEATPGMQWMIAKMVHTVVAPEKNHPAMIASKWINPTLFEKEILMTAERRKTENELFKTLLYGDSKSKTEAIQWIEEVLSWDGKRWLQGLLFDSDKAVRLQATLTIRKGMYHYYLSDLKIAYQNEKDKKVRSEMLKAIDRLK